MYLSRLYLNPRDRAVRRDLADCQAMHRTVMAAFPAVASESARAELGVLFRVEILDGGSRVALLVQSRARPDWSRLGAGYLDSGAGADENPACKQVDEIYGRIATGACLRFRLLANPSRKVDTLSGPDGERRNGRRVGLYDEEAQIEWLRRRGEQNGFVLLRARANDAAGSVDAKPAAMVVGRRPREDGLDDRPLTLAGVLFDGELRVTDPVRFGAALRNGVGPGKAYGLGLLSVAPLGGGG